MLTLSVNGTLSSWTTAIISNSTNTTATAQAVILQEVGPDGTAGHVSQTCQSSSDPSNSYSCTNINKYGGTTTPLTPGTTRADRCDVHQYRRISGVKFRLHTGHVQPEPDGGLRHTCRGRSVRWRER